MVNSFIGKFLLLWGVGMAIGLVIGLLGVNVGYNITYSYILVMGIISLTLILIGIKLIRWDLERIFYLSLYRYICYLWQRFWG